MLQCVFLELVNAAPQQSTVTTHIWENFQVALYCCSLILPLVVPNLFFLLHPFSSFLKHVATLRPFFAFSAFSSHLPSPFTRCLPLYSQSPTTKYFTSHFLYTSIRLRLLCFIHILLHLLFHMLFLMNTLFLLVVFCPSYFSSPSTEVLGNTLVTYLTTDLCIASESLCFLIQSATYVVISKDLYSVMILLRKYKFICLYLYIYFYLFSKTRIVCKLEQTSTETHPFKWHDYGGYNISSNYLFFIYIVWQLSC